MIRGDLHSTAQAAHYRAVGLWADRLLVDYIDEHADRTPDKTAITDSRGAITYGALREATLNLAASLSALGIRAGDVVAVQSPNWAELPIAHLALDRIGGVFLPVHDGFRKVEMLQILGRSAAVAMIAPAEYRGFNHRQLLGSLLPELPKLRHRIVMRDRACRGEVSFDALCADDSWRRTIGEDFLTNLRPDPQWPLQAMVSSGTTGIPKCSLFSDNNKTCQLLRQYGDYATHLSAEDVAAAIAPAGTGATGYIFPILAPLLHGASTVLLERWNGNRPGDALELIEDHRCTFAVVIPTQLVKMVRESTIERYRLGSLRFISNAGAKLEADVAEAAERLFGCPVQTIYGASDAGAPTMTSIDDPPAKRRTAGRLLEGEELRLLREDGREADPGEPGEVVWRGANCSYGYLNPAPDVSQAWDVDGWFYSGDIGRLDADGYLTIVGRKKDMIIRGGRNISPQQVEAVLSRHPKVADVAVLGLTDEVLGEVIGAVVVPASHDVPPTLDELKQSVLESGLPKWSQPERLILATDLVRNVGGKVDKRRLLTMVLEQRSLEAGVLRVQ